MTLDEAIQEFEFDCKIRHLSPKTIDNYKKQLCKDKGSTSALCCTILRGIHNSPFCTIALFGKTSQNHTEVPASLFGGRL